MLTDKEIEQVAVHCGMALGMRPPLRLMDDGKGGLRFGRDDRLTPYGENLLRFAKEIERITQGDKL